MSMNMNVSEEKDEVCKNCKHCHKTKELIDKKWVEYYICTLWLDAGEGEEPLLLTLGSENEICRPGKDLCECFDFKKDKDEV